MYGIVHKLRRPRSRSSKVSTGNGAAVIRPSDSPLFKSRPRLSLPAAEAPYIPLTPLPSLDDPSSADEPQPSPDQPSTSTAGRGAYREEPHQSHSPELRRRVRGERVPGLEEPKDFRSVDLHLPAESTPSFPDLQHVSWVPVFPTKRRSSFGGSKGEKHVLGRRNFERSTRLATMHYLTAALKSLEPRIDDDFIDRLNYYYTSSIIIMFAILVSAKQYVGHPIECWVPAQFTKAMEQYTESYCWIQNTYWVPFEDLIPSRIEDRERRQIGYYQWVPFILAIQALMFYIPATVSPVPIHPNCVPLLSFPVWRLLNTQSGINVHGILQMACNEHNIEPENRAKTVGILARHIDDALRYQRDFGNKQKPVYIWAFIRLGKYYGAYVTLLYTFSKFLYLSNVLGQFFLLNRFLETNDYPLFGAHVIWDLLRGMEWKDSGKFPRSTLCDFEIRVLGNIHRHTVQCVLVINMFTEKIFVFLWLWFLFLTICTLSNLIFWLTTLAIPSLRRRFIHKYLELSDFPPEMGKDEKLLNRFVVNFLRPDGVFILRLVAAHSGTILCTELTYTLWLRFKERLKPPRALSHLHDSASSGASTIPSPLDKLTGEAEGRLEADPWEPKPPPVVPLKPSSLKAKAQSGPPPPEPPDDFASSHYV